MCIALTNRTTTTKTLDRLQILNGYLRAADQLLAREGYDVFISEDLRGWIGAMDRAADINWINPAFDPDATGPHDSALWVGVTKGDDLVSVFASRLFTGVNGYYDMVRRGLVWSREENPVPIEINEAGPSGLIASSGGHWVHPDHRGLGLSWAVPRYGQAASLLIWKADFIAGMVTSGVNSGRVPANYGAAATRLMVDGWFWPMETEVKVFATEYPADFFIERSLADWRMIMEEPHKKVVDFAPVARKRNK